MNDDVPTLALVTLLALGGAAIAGGVLHLYRYYRWIQHGEAMP